MDSEAMGQALEHCEFFEGLAKSDIVEITGLCRTNAYEGGEYVFQQGDYGEHLYVIVEGLIHLERSVDLGGRKGIVVIETLGKGRILGCWSTLLDLPHILLSSAACQKPTKTLAIKGVDLRQMMIHNTAFGFNIMERLCFVLRDRIQAAYGAMEKI